MALLTADLLDDTVREWHTTADGLTIERNSAYRPTLFIDGDETNLRQLRERISLDPKVARTVFEEKYPDLHAESPSEVLRVDVERVADVEALAHEVRHYHEPEAFRPATFQLYNVDLAPLFRYCLETDTSPIPERQLRCLFLSLDERSVADNDVSALHIGGEPVAGDASTVLRVLQARLEAVDPDVLIVSTATLVPLLEETAADLDLDDVHLGRRPGYTQLAGESTFHSYGNTGHSPARYRIPGRVIVDTSNSFLYAESGLQGLIDLVERSWKPLQETAWGSIGNILTAIQIRKAYQRDLLVPWRKWDAEAFKTVGELHDGDRGGFIFDPDVGFHEDVVEIDFASLYPNIMCEFNLSPETVRCDCHDTEDVPGLGYSVCDRPGFISDVLRPLIDDRAAYKRRRAETDDSDEQRRLTQRVDALKWILVSCFGYQGFRNSKFGRIEVHEAINAYAREILLDSREVLAEHGWEVVHGIVDSLWVTPFDDEEQTPISAVCQQITDDVDIRLEHENDFDWVAFVPKRDSRAGTLTKYFGKVADSDEFKVRGIEARQRSTPAYVATVQEELLERLDETRDPDQCLELLQRRLSELKRGAVDPVTLTIRTRVSKPAEAYTQSTVSVAAVRRSEELGVPKPPGQDARYVVVDDAASGVERVRLHFENVEDYDAAYYRDLLIRAAESVLSPLGVDRHHIQQFLRETHDSRLRSYT